MKIHVLILCCTYLIEFGQPFVTVNTLIRITTTNRNGTITSPGYPGHYPNDVIYTWDLETGFRQANVTFFVKVSDIFENSNGQCEGDYLEIEETIPCCFRHYRRCGKESNVSFMATGNRIRISFLSNGIDTAQGFVLYWHGFLPSSSFSTTFEVKATTPMTTMNTSFTMMSLTTTELTSTNEPLTPATLSETTTALLIGGFCVLEVTVIITGVYMLRQLRIRTPLRRPKKAKFFSDNFYDTIPVHHIRS